MPLRARWDRQVRLEALFATHSPSSNLQAGLPCNPARPGRSVSGAWRRNAALFAKIRLCCDTAMVAWASGRSTNSSSDSVAVNYSPAAASDGYVALTQEIWASGFVDRPDPGTLSSTAAGLQDAV